MAMCVEQKIVLVRSFGFVLLARDYSVKADFAGTWMVKDLHDSGADQWAVVGDDPEDLLDSAIDAHELTRYLVGEWEHIFNEEDPASQCRMVLDKVDQTVVHAQVLVDHEWKPVSREGLKDLLESLNDNDIWSDPDMQDELESTNEMPDWVK